ncbi:MAG TPA: chromophore lyase CpcT/CpeT [Steroidobacteraceae bacterium]|jgi:hypothetical protein|nr:chromophore lyase CpcT/CpeT [Steroidobacteraceae bacterium]
MNKTGKYGYAGILGMACLAVLANFPASAWASKKDKEQEAAYLSFLKMLPGSFDNLAQADESSGQTQPVILSIRPLDLQLIGKLVLLVRETAANDPHRLLAEHIWTVDRDKDKNIVQHVYQFKEPQRWKGAGDDSMLLQSLLPDDLQKEGGCDIYWTKSGDGFSGATRPHACRPGASEEGHLVEIAAELTADDLTLTELQAGPGGRLPTDTASTSPLHFQRRGD